MRTYLLLPLLVACTTNDPVCGDGEVYDNINDPVNFEECDDGNNVAGDGCTACLIDTHCGDGVVDPGEDCDDGNTVGNDGCSPTCTMEQTFALTANWSFKNVATNQITGCPNGFEIIRAVTQPLDASGNPTGSPIIDMFNCSANTGMAKFVPNRYRTFLESTNMAGTQVYAQSTTADIDLRTNNATYTTTIVNDGGYFVFDWTLRGAVSNNALTCTQAASTKVSLLSTVMGTTTATEDLFPCENGTGLSGALLGGTYVVSISALNSAMQAVGTAPAQTNKVIQSPNKITDLGTITIPIDNL